MTVFGECVFLVWISRKRIIGVKNLLIYIFLLQMLSTYIYFFENLAKWFIIRERNDGTYKKSSRHNGVPRIDYLQYRAFISLKIICSR